MKPILFNTDMVRAILEGRKTVTRRVVKLKYSNTHLEMRTDKYGTRLIELQNEEPGVTTVRNPNGTTTHKLLAAIERTPLYHPGDILYVRETWQEVYETEFDADAPGSCVNIRTLIPNFDSIPKNEAGISTNCSCAAMKPRMKYYVFKASDIEYADPQNKLVWSPSIHMPREAARIFLRVTDVRVERLQDMTIKDSLREGVKLNLKECVAGEIPLAPFARVWDSTIKETDRALYGWEANPWVWVIEFERISKEEAQYE